MEVQSHYKALLKGILYIEFIKKNGKLRKMYCTRNNRHINGHSDVNFAQKRFVNQENKYPHQLFVFDLQEEDVRIVNLKTIQKEVHFENLDMVAIPPIQKRKESTLVAVENAEQILQSQVTDVELPF